MAHDTAQFDAVEPGAVLLQQVPKAGHFNGVETKPRHRRVDMKRSGKLRRVCERPITPSLELSKAVDDRDHAVGNETVFLSFMTAAKCENPRVGMAAFCKRLTKR